MEEHGKSHALFNMSHFLYIFLFVHTLVRAREKKAEIKNLRLIYDDFTDFTSFFFVK